MFGVEVIVLLLFFIAVAVSDWKTGAIRVEFLLIPTLILILFSFNTFLNLFFPIFAILGIMWLTVWRLKGIGLLNPKNPYLGFGDVLAIPLAFCIVDLAFPFIGLAIFAGVLAVQSPFLFRKKFIRMLPWFLAPVTIAVIPGLFL